MKPKAVLAYCREKGIRSFDLRYTDLLGEWRHVSLPIASLTERLFEEGLGHDVSLMAPGNGSDFAILLPDSEANYLDPFTYQPTLVIAASVQDVVHRQDSPVDSRSVLVQSERFLQSTGVADEVQVRSTLRFDIPVDAPLSRAQCESSHDPSNSSPDAGWNSARAATAAQPSMARLNGPFDAQFLNRAHRVEQATDAGLRIERHAKSADGLSEVVLAAATPLQACDDSMMLRYLLANAQATECLGDSSKDTTATTSLVTPFWGTSHWSFLQSGVPVFSDGTYQACSEAGLYAQAGIFKHAQALSCIFLLSQSSSTEVLFPFTNRITGSEDSANGLRIVCQDARVATNPREFAVDVACVPTGGNPYLAYAAIMMAMADGLANRVLPAEVIPHGSSELLLCDSDQRWSREACANALEKGHEFLTRGDVFSAELIGWILERIRMCS